jgi:hypothetical protein
MTFHESSPVVPVSMTISRMVELINIPSGIAQTACPRYRRGIFAARDHLMYQLISQWLRQTYNVCKQLLYFVFIYFLGKDLIDQQSAISTVFVLAILYAALLFFDPVVDLLLRVGIIALVVLVSFGYCGEPNLFYGICNCSLIAGKLTFHGITDVIHRLLAGPTHP